MEWSSSPLRLADTFGAAAQGYSTVGAGTYHSCGIRSGAAWCWGYNDAGELGQNFVDFTIYGLVGPQLVLDPAAGSQTYLRLSTGSAHTCAVATGGNTYCWGYNSLWDGAMNVNSGQIGDGTFTDALIPTEVVGTQVWSAIDVGLYHSCGVNSSDNTLYCWGNNAASQLGSNGTTEQSTPALVDFP